jgi:mRNA interferase RelE/StbE
MRIEFLDAFLEAYDSLPLQERERVQRAVQRLGENWRHPGLQVKRMHGKEGLWEARVTLSLRITFQLDGDLITLRNVGAHDKTLKDA